MQHEQVFIKINGTCDKGIAPLVVALNEIPGLITLDSCQSGAYGEAYVFFTYGNKWEELASFLQGLSSQLSKYKLCCGYRLRLEWFGNNDQPRAQLVLESKHVVDVADGIRTLVTQPSDHMTPLDDDR